MKRLHIIATIMALMAVLAAGAKDPVLAPSYAWMLIEPLGLRKPTTIDTIYLNYARESVLYRGVGRMGHHRKPWLRGDEPHIYGPPADE